MLHPRNAANAAPSGDSGARAMAIPNDDELLRLLRGGESHRVEFKER